MPPVQQSNGASPLHAVVPSGGGDDVGAVERIGGRAVEETTISRNIGDARDQNIDFEEILKVKFAGDPAHKLRLRIRSNFYEFQCWSIIERWDGNKWHQIHKLQDRKTESGLASRGRRDSVRNLDFEEDRKELLRVAKEVLAP